MRITVDMKKLQHILVALFLVIAPVTQGKPINSQTQSNSTLKQSTENVEFSNANTSKNTGHNNLLSDLARISKDEETNVGNRQTIVGTEVSAATVKNSNESTDSNESSEDPDSNTRTMVTSAPTETEAPSYFTSPSPTSEVTESAGTTANNDMSLVRLSEPTHIVLSKSKDEENPFSKLITSNENALEEEKSNDAVNKQQELSPLISERTESTPVDESSENTESAFTGSFGTDPTAATFDESKQQESKDNGEVNNGQAFLEESSSAKVHDDAVKSEQQSQNVDKGVKDAATDHVVVCAGEKQTITCPADATLKIASADYGYDSNSGCPVDSSSGSPSCQANGVYPVVKSACQGQASCLLQSDGQEFGGMCPGQNNFLKVGYSCQNEAPSSYSVPPPAPPPAAAAPPPAAASPQPPASSYAYQTSPYIPHPLSTQPTTYYNNYAYNQPNAISYNNYAYNQPKTNGYNTGYMNDNNPGKSHYPYYGNYGNQGYYNYYNQPSRRRPSQTMGSQRRPSQTMGSQRRPSQTMGSRGHPSQTNYGYKPRLPLRSERPRPAARPHRPRNNYGSLVNSQYRDSNRYPQRNYNDYYNNRNNYYNTRDSYYNTRNNNYDTRYYDQPYSPYRQAYRGPQYPRNSYLGSCYACQNCQQCSEQAYCQGCPKCKDLPCGKKPPKEERYMDPIDSLVEEFGKKTKGMTPMEMSAVVISPAPKVPEIAYSSPLPPPPKPLEEENDDDDDDSDDDSDENEFTFSKDESNDESSLSQKKTSVSSSKSSVHSEKDKQSKNKAKKSEKKNKIYHRKHKVKEIYDDDDDEDGYDLKVYQNLLKKSKPKRSKIHRHKNAHHSKRRKSRRRLSKRWYDENENLISQNEDRAVESPNYYDATMFW